MTNVIDEQASLKHKPGFHAFIVGVSVYPHLPGGNGPKAPDTLKMKQLTSSALTAYRVFKWLEERKADLPVPLATCELLLSPSPDELKIEPALTGLAENATWENFERAAKSWRDAAKKDSNGVTFFYFAGHGMQRTLSAEQILVLEDFGNGQGGLLRNCVGFNNFYMGMAPIGDFKKLARTQLYFVDACRTIHEAVLAYENELCSPIWNTAARAQDERQESIFFAAVPGKTAYGLKGDQTIFSKALLACLNGGAGELQNEEWQVSVSSLNRGLAYHIGLLNKQLIADPKQGKRDQAFRVSGLTPETVIRRFVKPPTVDLMIEVDPDDVDVRRKIKVEAMQDGGKLEEAPLPLEPHPFLWKLPGGYYRLRAKIEPPDARYVDCPETTTHLLMPPGKRAKVRVVPEGKVSLQAL